MKVTVKLLRKNGACQSQILLFQYLFPDGVEVTEEGCLEYWNGFNWDWAAHNLLSPNACEEFEKIRASAREKFEKSKSSATWEKYERTKASAFGRLASHQENNNWYTKLLNFLSFRGGK